VNWYRNTNVSEEGSSSTPKILGARFDVLKEVKIKVIFWIYSSGFVSGFHIFIAAALSLVSTYLWELLVSTLQYFTRCKF